MQGNIWRISRPAWSDMLKIVALSLALVSVVAIARAEESIFASLPCVDNSYRAIIPSGPDDKILKDIPRGPYNINVKVLNLPVGLESGDMRAALERGVYGCGQDRLVARQSFTPKRFAEQLKMQNELFGHLTNRGRWVVVDESVSDTNMMFCVWRETTGGANLRECVLWYEYRFMFQGSAYCAFYVKSFNKDEDFKFEDEIRRQKGVVSRWVAEMSNSFAETDKTIGGMLFSIARSRCTAVPVEVLPRVWVPVPSPDYLLIDASNVLSKLVWPMTRDKYLATTLVSCFSTNLTETARPFDSEIGLPAVRQLADVSGRTLKTRNYVKHLENLAKSLDYMRAVDFRVNVGGVDRDKWIELDRLLGHDALRYSACVGAQEGFKSVLSHRHFLLNGNALYLSLRRDFPENAHVDAKEIARRQSDFLARWEVAIREVTQEKNREKYDSTGKTAETDGASIPCKPSTEQVKPVFAAADSSRHSDAEMRCEIAQQESLVAKRKPSKVISLFGVALVVMIVVGWVCRRKKQPLCDVKRERPHQPADANEEKCYFCGRTAYVEDVVEFSLHGNHKTGLDHTSWQVVSFKLPCCCACYEELHRESSRTWSLWLMIASAVYVLCVAVLAVTFDLPVSAACVISILPGFFTFGILAGLTPVPFAPSWHGKVASIPKVTLLLSQGFKLTLSVKRDACRCESESIQESEVRWSC